jgi:hypothetical protein
MDADPNKVCKIMVDVTDFWIYEPSPFNTKWFSHKINGPAVRYKVGVCIKTGWIVWINCPFPAGAWPDVNIAHHSLIHFLDAGEYYAADGGYADGHRFASNGLNDYEQRTKALAHAHHETVNHHFKVFGCLSQRYRHCLVLHGTIFHAVASIVQLTIHFGHPLFDIEYNEADFLPNAKWN